MNTLQNPPAKQTPVSTLEWDSSKVRKLIDACETEGGPSTLEVGKQQKIALVDHLAAAFGSESISNRDLYYMGLSVLEVELEDHLAVSGSRRIKAKKRSDNVLESGNTWQFRA